MDNTLSEGQTRMLWLLKRHKNKVFKLDTLIKLFLTEEANFCTRVLIKSTSNKKTPVDVLKGNYYHTPFKIGSNQYTYKKD